MDKKSLRPVRRKAEEVLILAKVYSLEKKKYTPAFPQMIMDKKLREETCRFHDNRYSETPEERDIVKGFSRKNRVINDVEK